VGTLSLPKTLVSSGRSEFRIAATTSRLRRYVLSSLRDYVIVGKNTGTAWLAQRVYSTVFATVRSLIRTHAAIVTRWMMLAAPSQK